METKQAIYCDQSERRFMLAVLLIVTAVILATLGIKITVAMKPAEKSQSRLHVSTKEDPGVIRLQAYLDQARQNREQSQNAVEGILRENARQNQEIGRFAFSK